jgi:hypothetical protein
LLPHAEKCSGARAELKSRHLYELSAKGKSTTDVIRPYQEKTGLSVDDLIHLFNLPDWDTGPDGEPDYGGPKWAKIAETLKGLISALESGNMIRARGIADCVSDLCHNNGHLVPSRAEWNNPRKPYLKEKWPELCD